MFFLTEFPLFSTLLECLSLWSRKVAWAGTCRSPDGLRAWTPCPAAFVPLGYESAPDRASRRQTLRGLLQESGPPHLLGPARPREDTATALSHRLALAVPLTLCLPPNKTLPCPSGNKNNSTLTFSSSSNFLKKVHSATSTSSAIFALFPRAALTLSPGLGGCVL